MDVQFWANLIGKRQSSKWARGGVLTLVLVALALAGCRQAEPTPTPAPTATPVPPTATPVPTPTQVTAWDYMALGDTTVLMGGYYGDLAFPFHYASHIEADLGVEVNFLNRAGAHYTSADVLDDILKKEDLREEIRQAKIVTVYVGREDGNQGFHNYEKQECGGEDNLDCMREVYNTLKSNYDAILDELLALCTPGAIIRASTVFYGDLAAWGLPNSGPLVGGLNEQILTSSAEQDVPVARVDVAFNGPAGDQIPDPAFFRDDGHPSKLGAVAMADAFRELGYEATCR